MKFLVTSTTLANKLAEMSKVMTSKTASPILSHFLFELEGENLQITASDGECFQHSVLPVATVEGSGKVCLPADRLLNALRNMPEQPIGFTINETTLNITVKYTNGHYEFVGNSADEYSTPSSLSHDAKQVQIEAEMLNTAISIIVCRSNRRLTPYYERSIPYYERRNVPKCSNRRTQISAQHLQIGKSPRRS